MHATLGDLFSIVPGALIRGDASVRISAPVTDSRRVAPGALFFAIGGLRTSGAQYVGEAVLRGAAAVVVTDPSEVPPGIPCVVVADVRKALALASREFYGRPDESLSVLGVTGTNGKTTVSMLVRHLMQCSGGRPWGLVGTVRYELGDRSIPSHKTTPESVDIYGMMSGMVRAGCEGLAMEVSSHAVDQDRVHGLRFKAVAFTNLSRDHMDYHGDMESYFAVKARVFAGSPGSPPECALINADDEWGARLAASLSGGVRVLRFGTGRDADIRAERVRLGSGGSEFEVVWGGGRAPVRTRLPGHYNVSNVLCALALCHAAGRDIATLAPLLEKFPGVPGRMEKVADGLPFEVLVDYAHTDDALRNALGMLRPITPGRLLVVFGCGGNRDRGKRPKMTAAVQGTADFAWATSDNPRRESPEDIFADMRGGVSRPEAIAFVPDRRRAISLALDAAQPGDCVLIAGKGHETYQEFADTTVPFDDREVARELLELKSLRTR